MERFAPATFAFASLAAVVCYGLRRLRVSAEYGLGGMVFALIVTAAVIGFRLRRKFFDTDDARHLLEWSLNLNSRLTAALDGLVPWPEWAEPLPKIVRWRSANLLSWLGGAAFILVASFLWPVPVFVERAPSPVERPPSLVETETLLRELEKTEIADPQSLEQLEVQAQELANRPSELQYTHSGLEAADALRDETLAAIDTLAREFESAASAFGPTEGAASTSGEGNLKPEGGGLSAALQGLRDGKLPANPALLGGLAHATPSSLRNLTPQQTAELADRFNKAGGKARGIAGAVRGKAAVAKGDAHGKGGLSQAPGGTGGGEFSAPLAFYEKPTAANDGKLEALTSEDLSRASLGDALGATQEKPQVDSAKAAGPMSAGVVGAAARGGETVWVDHLAPAERAALKDFFK